MRKCVLAVLVLSVVCTAQVTTGRRRQTKQTGISSLETPTATFHGTLTSVTKKELVLGVGEDQAITFYISHKTKFLKDSKPIKPTEIASGALLTVDGKRDAMGNTEATTVTVETPKPQPAPAPATFRSGDPPPQH